MSRAPAVFNAFIRTHHVTSRKKVQRLKKFAHKHINYVLIRSGGSPGLMYAEGDEAGVTDWVASVQNLRYKDYQCLRKPTPLESESRSDPTSTIFEEVETVALFAEKMSQRGLLEWWRRAMGYADDHKSINS